MCGEALAEPRAVRSALCASADRQRCARHLQFAVWRRGRGEPPAVRSVAASLVTELRVERARPADQRRWSRWCWVSTRRYARSLEPLPQTVQVRASARVRWRPVCLCTERKLAELMSRNLRGLALVALMIDGVHFGEHVVLRRWESMSVAASRCWGCAKGRLRTRRRLRPCSPI